MGRALKRFPHWHITEIRVIGSAAFNSTISSSAAGTVSDWPQAGQGTTRPAKKSAASNCWPHWQETTDGMIQGYSTWLVSLWHDALRRESRLGTSHHALLNQSRDVILNDSR